MSNLTNDEKELATAMELFRQNARNMVRLIELDGIIVKRISSGDIAGSFEEKQRREIEAMLLVDGIAKFCILVEGLLALLYTSWRQLSSSQAARFMARFESQKLQGFKERIESRNVNLWYMLGLPNLGRLALSKENRRFVYQQMRLSVDSSYEGLVELTRAYSCMSMIYNKYKHGISLLHLHDKVNYQIVTFDRLDSDPPCLCRKQSVTTNAWFNTMTFLRFDQQFFDQFNKWLKEVMELIEFVVDAHLTRMTNPNGRYVPLKEIAPDRWSATLLLNPVRVRVDGEKYDAAVRDIVQAMNVTRYRFNFNLNDVNYSSTLDCLKKYGLAVFKFQ